MRKSNLNEDILGDLGAAFRGIAGLPGVKNIVDLISGSDDESDADGLLDKIRGLGEEKIPLSAALRANPAPTAYVVGSSQAGVTGTHVARDLESAGFKDLNLKIFPARSMRGLFAAIAAARNSNPAKYDAYDVVVIFPGFKAGHGIQSQIDSVTSIIDLFEPARCFVVLPPPVTQIVDTFAASRAGLNKGRPVSRDYWFNVSDGTYSADRETFRKDLAAAVDAAGATAIDPTDAVSGRFPDSPDGLHPAPETAQSIARTVTDTIMQTEKTVSGAGMLKTVNADALKRDPDSLAALAGFPATAAALSAASGRTTSGFGQRKDPFTGELKGHQGIDIGVPVGTPTKAPLDGTVITVVNGNPKAGNFVEIKHANGDVTRYLHMSDIMVSVGDDVKKGEVFAKTGNTGRSTGPHLHWETWQGGGFKKGKLMNPKDWLAANTGAIKPVSFT